MSEPSRVLGGRYALRQHVGRGAMGVVWLATDELLHREVAVKQLLLPAGLSHEEAAESRSRAMREARIAARLHHPHAVSVFDVVVEDGQPWLVMEYVRSRSLGAVIAEDGPLSPMEAARIGAGAAAALAAAHELGIVHRDVKPGNILLGDRGTVKITDFGISRATGDVTVTQTGVLAGTPAYLAPEVARGAVSDASSDVFSLGATLYAAVEGRPPFGVDENSLAMLHRVATGQVEPPRRAGELTDVLGQLLAPDPAGRPTAARAAELLAVVERGQPPPSDAATESLPCPEPPTRLILGSPHVGGGTWSTDVPAEPRRWPRGLVPAATVGALLAVVGAFVVVALTAGGGNTAGDPTPETVTGEPRTLAGSSSQPTTTAPTTTPVTTPPTTTPSTTTPSRPPAPGVAEVSEFVKGHYAALPEDTLTAWNNLTPQRRPDYPAYTQFWSQFVDVSLQGEPKVAAVEATRFTAEVRIRFQPREGSNTSVEPYLLDILVVDGRLMIDQSAPLNG